MFGDKFNLMSLMKNAGKIKEMMEKTQSDLSKIEVSGESGAGAVKIIMNAKHHVKNLHLDDELLKESKAVIEELIIAAYNNANEKVEEITKSAMMDMGKLFGGSDKGEE